MSLSRTLSRSHSADTLTHSLTDTHAPIPSHTLYDPSTPSPAPCTPRSPHLMPSEERSCIERELETMLVLSKDCRHLPPLEHLVLSCWAWTENSTIGSLMNCYFWTRDKHTALYGLSLQSVIVDLRFSSAVQIF